MTFKKTITFTARVSDYTAGTVSARVQAENKILSDFVTFILAQGLNIQQVEKVSIGDSMWSGSPMNATTGATSLVYNDSLLSDVYFLGKGIDKKCLGLCVDNHTLYAGFSDTASHDMTFSQTAGANNGRLPTNQLRRLRTATIEANRKQYGGTVDLATFSTSADEISMTIFYYKGPGSLVIRRADNDKSAVALFADPASVFIYGGTMACALTFALTDPITIDDTTYTGQARNNNYAVNAAKSFGMSFDPAVVHDASYATWETPANFGTAVAAHCIGILDLYTSSTNISSRAPANPVNGLATGASTPSASLYNFPRIMNNELYIKKLYIPLTYPAITSPVKVGYTPGILYAGTVYQLNGKYYLSITQGVIGYFIEVADQGA